MTAKSNTIGGPQAPVFALKTSSAVASAVVDFGATPGTRKRLFKFAKPSLAKRSRKIALGPTRSEFGCD